MLTVDELSASNLAFETRYYHVFGRGVGLGAEFVGLLKAVALCQRKGLRFCLQKNSRPRGFAFERGWCDYFEPIFPEVDLRWLAAMNRTSYPLDRLPICRFIARSLIRNLSDAGYSMCDDLAVLPDRADAPTFEDEATYWSYMQHLARLLWRFNSETRRTLAEIQPASRLPEKYLALHIRRGDKRSEVPYVDAGSYLRAVERLGAGVPTAVYVATDDDSAFEELRRKLGERFDCYRSPVSYSSGYDQEVFNESKAEYRRRMTCAFLYDLQVIFGSTLFIASSTSNVYYIARYFRANEGMSDVESLSGREASRS